jgi:hypothetical protein
MAHTCILVITSGEFSANSRFFTVREFSDGKGLFANFGLSSWLSKISPDFAAQTAWMTQHARVWWSGRAHNCHDSVH